MRLLIAVMTMVSLIAGCASQPENLDLATSATGPKTMIVEQSLSGKLQGDGVFINSLTGGETKFSVLMDGTWDGKKLTLVEDFTFADGSQERKTWVLTKVAEGVYEGTREDVIGIADVRQDGPNVRLDYYVTLHTGIGVRFRDIMYVNADGTITNKAVVSKFGLRVGRVEITMRPLGKPGA
jgi:hypothetical protein